MKHKITILIFILSLINLYAEGGPPMFTDGPGTPGDGHWEINSAITGELRASQHSYALPQIDINYGLGNDIQLKVETSYVHIDDVDKSANGIGDILAGVKWQFYNANDWMLSVYPQMGFAPIKNSVVQGLAEYDTITILPLEITKKLDDYWITTEIGYMKVDHRDDRMKYGLILGYDVNKALTIMSEIYSDQQINKRDETDLVNFGLTYSLNTQIGLLLSVGKEIQTSQSQRATLFYSGVQILF